MKIAIVAREVPIKHRDLLIKSLISENSTIEFILWNKNKFVYNTNEKVYVYNKELENYRSFKSLFRFLKFVEFARKIIKDKRFDVIILSHYTIFIPFLLKGSIQNSKIYIDAHDLPSFNNFIVPKVILAIEKYLLKKTIDGVIIASKHFARFYKYKRTFLLDNLPPLNQQNFKRISNTKQKDYITIGFVGSIRYPVLYKKLIDVISTKNVELHFFGSGPSEKDLYLYGQRIGAKNIYFHGKFEKDQISKIYSKIDLVWACYPPNNFNVVYATSNKFIESKFFCTPGVFSTGTLNGNEVDQLKIGFSVDPFNKVELSSFIESLTMEEIEVRVKNLKSLILPDLNKISREFKSFILNSKG